MTDINKVDNQVDKKKPDENKSKSGAASTVYHGADEVLHDFAVAESLNEMSLADKLKRNVISADEYDERLVENYRENKSQAKAKLQADLLAMVGEDGYVHPNFTHTAKWRECKAKNQLKAVLREKIKEYFSNGI